MTILQLFGLGLIVIYSVYSLYALIVERDFWERIKAVVEKGKK